MGAASTERAVSHALYTCFFFTGLGYLFPFNVLVSDIDFLKQHYPELNLEFIISVCYNVPCVFVLLVLVKFGDRFSFSSRIYAAFALDLVVLASLAAIRFLVVSSELLLWSTVVGSVLTGCAAAVLDGTIFGLASKFPSKCVQAVMAAIPLSGTITGLQKIIIKLIVAEGVINEGEVSEAVIDAETQMNSRIYFIVSCVMILGSTLSYFFLRRRNEAKAVLAEDEQGLSTISDRGEVVINAEESQSLLLRPRDSMERDRRSTNSGSTGMDLDGVDHKHLYAEPISTRGTRSGLKPPVKRAKVFRNVFVQGATVFLSYTISLAVYPGVISSMVPDDPNFETWYPIILLTAVQVSDMAGRYLPLLPIPRVMHKVNWIFAIARIAFIPLLVFSVKPRVFGEAVGVTFVVVSSISFGFISTLAMGDAPAKVSKEEAEVAGTIMSFCLNAGLVTGSLVGLGIEAYLVGGV